MTELLKTVFYDRHVKHGAKITEFSGWHKPLQYPTGIMKEHLATRKQAGLFDVSHMGRFIISGADALPFLQHVLTNNAASLDVGLAQYTMIPNETGGVIDDAYLYRFFEDEYLLVVNAANREKDWAQLERVRKQFPRTTMTDRTRDIAMLSLQGPMAKDILAPLIEGELPEPMRNELSIVSIEGEEVWVSRTGYTGEPISFVLFFQHEDAAHSWDLLTDGGAVPVGLGARDSLRLEAGLPLYGHELGTDPEGNEIPAFASSLSRFAVSFSPLKGEFIGKKPLHRQFQAFKRIMDLKFDDIAALPRRIQLLELGGKGITRPGDSVFVGEKRVGFVTSGTMVPYWHTAGEGVESQFTDEKERRAIAMALVDSEVWEDDIVDVEIRGRRVNAMVVPYLLRGEAPPYARSIIHHREAESDVAPSSATFPPKAGDFL